MPEKVASLVLLALMLLECSRLIEFARELLVDGLAQCSFEKLAGVATFCAGKAFGFNLRFTRRRHNDFDLHATPPTLIVSLTEPSESRCSVIV